VATVGDSINLTHLNSNTRGGRVGKQVAQTLDCACNQGIVEVAPIQLGNSKTRGEYFGKNGDSAFCLRASQCNGVIENNYKIRKLTPRECFRLQDFPETFKFVVSNSQLYKQAGNSISVNMMEMIFNQIEKSRSQSLLGGLFG
jgi:DNA (cytosine-5)-methyltransferase 1